MRYLIVLLFFPLASFANTLSATGGLQFGRNSGMNDLKNTNPLVGAAYSFDLGAHLEVGGFYDYNFLVFQDGSEGSLAFMGMMARYEQQRNQGFLAEVKLGLGEASDTNLDTHSLFSYGAAVGYRFPLGAVVSVGPRVDLRYLPQSPDPSTGRESMADFGLMLSFKL